MVIVCDVGHTVDHTSLLPCVGHTRRVSTVSAWFEVSRVYSSRNSDHECVSVNISFSTWHFSVKIFHLFNFIHFWNFIRNLNSTYLRIFWKWHYQHLCSQPKHPPLAKFNYQSPQSFTLEYTVSIRASKSSSCFRFSCTPMVIRRANIFRTNTCTS